ncbi:MAG: hypothetical protein R3A80_01700 [Bdellovibrionota bacterium]
MNTFNKQLIQLSLSLCVVSFAGPADANFKNVNGDRSLDKTSVKAEASKIRSIVLDEKLGSYADMSDPEIVGRVVARLEARCKAFHSSLNRLYHGIYMSEKYTLDIMEFYSPGDDTAVGITAICISRP